MTFELPVLLCTDPFLPGTGEESEVHSKDWDVRSWLVLFLLICLFFSKYPQNNDEKEKKLNQWEKENKQRSNRCALCSFRAIIVSSMTTSNRVANTLESFRSTRLTWQYTQQHRRNRADRKNRNSTARSLARTHTQKYNNRMTWQKWKNSFIVRWFLTLSVSILEQNDHRRHEHDSLHVDDVIHEGIYAENRRRTSLAHGFDRVRRHTFRSRGIRPSLSSFARAARRFKIRLYCLALTYNGSSSVGSDAIAAWFDADDDAVDVVMLPVCIWTACNWPELPGTILNETRVKKQIRALMKVDDEY